MSAVEFHLGQSHRTPAPNRKVARAAILSVVLTAAGCAASGPPQAITPPTPLAAADYPAVFDVSVAVLRDAGFGIDRQDFRFGQISTKPKGSPTIIEAWKPDNTYADQALRSTLGDLRRTVAVSFTPAPGSGSGPGSEGGHDHPDDLTADGYAIDVEVLVERLQVPQRRMNGATRGVVFADLAEVPEELQARGITGSYWQPVGRDVHLEQRLLRDILNRTPNPDG